MGIFTIGIITKYYLNDLYISTEFEKLFKFSSESNKKRSAVGHSYLFLIEGVARTSTFVEGIAYFSGRLSLPLKEKGVSRRL